MLHLNLMSFFKKKKKKKAENCEMKAIKLGNKRLSCGILAFKNMTLRPQFLGIIALYFLLKTNQQLEALHVLSEIFPGKTNNNNQKSFCEVVSG